MPYQTNGINYQDPGFSPYGAPYNYPNQLGYPFMQSYPQVQQPMSQPQTYSNQPSNPVPVRGRVIKTETDISPRDVPMDGFASYFPADDGSCIYVKFWDKDGKIQTQKFVPEVSGTSDPASSTSFEDEMRQGMADIKKLLSRQNYKPKYRKPANNQTSHDGSKNDAD